MPFGISHMTRVEMETAIFCPSHGRPMSDLWDGTISRQSEKLLILWGFLVSAEGLEPSTP